MFCPHCGKQVEGEARFCPHCGKEISPVPGPGPNPPKTPNIPFLVSDIALAALLTFAPAVTVNAYMFGYGEHSIPAFGLKLFSFASDIAQYGYGSSSMSSVGAACAGFGVVLLIAWAAAMFFLVKSAGADYRGDTSESGGAIATIVASGLVIVAIMILNGAITSNSDGSYLSDFVYSAAASVLTANMMCYLMLAAGIGVYFWRQKGSAK